jgi:DNA-binding NarL/FixJ family response regulator
MRVLIADDHPMVRDALARTLQQLDASVDVAQAADFDGLLALLEGAAADLALVDLHMPGMDGASGVRQIRAAAPLLPLVVASGHDDPATIRAVLGAGAAGFVPKTSSSELLRRALQIVLAGGVYVPQQALADLPAEAPATTDATGLTPRQRDVLRGLLRGAPNKVIARDLGLTEGTVKIHIAAILRVLQVRNRTEAVVRARELDLDAP